jgi:hypothetical protein
VTPCSFAAWPISVTAQTPTPTLIVPTSTPTCPPCFCAGYLDVQGPRVVPSQPLVGDLVTFTFSIYYWGAGEADCGLSGSGFCKFQQDDSLLDGDEPPTRDGETVVVRRRVVGAGVTTVQLEVFTITEYACYYHDPLYGCQPTYSWSCWLDDSSPPFDLELAEAPSPTPTPTLAATPTLSPTPSLCVGDCHSDHSVTVDELLIMVNIALGNAGVDTCGAGDANHDGKITIDEILAAVNNALNSCAR